MSNIFQGGYPLGSQWIANNSFNNLSRFNSNGFIYFWTLSAFQTIDDLYKLRQAPENFTIETGSTSLITDEEGQPLAIPSFIQLEEIKNRGDQNFTTDMVEQIEKKERLSVLLNFPFKEPSGTLIFATNKLLRSVPDSSGNLIVKTPFFRITKIVPIRDGRGRWVQTKITLDKFSALLTKSDSGGTTIINIKEGFAQPDDIDYLQIEFDNFAMIQKIEILIEGQSETYNYDVNFADVYGAAETETGTFIVVPQPTDIYWDFLFVYPKVASSTQVIWASEWLYEINYFQQNWEFMSFTNEDTTDSSGIFEIFESEAFTRGIPLTEYKTRIYNVIGPGFTPEEVRFNVLFPATSLTLLYSSTDSNNQGWGLEGEPKHQWSTTLQPLVAEYSNIRDVQDKVYYSNIRRNNNDLKGSLDFTGDSYYGEFGVAGIETSFGPISANSYDGDEFGLKWGYHLDFLKNEAIPFIPGDDNFPFELTPVQKPTEIPDNEFISENNRTQMQNYQDQVPDKEFLSLIPKDLKGFADNGNYWNKQVFTQEETTRWGAILPNEWTYLRAINFTGSEIKADLFNGEIAFEPQPGGISKRPKILLNLSQGGDKVTIRQLTIKYYGGSVIRTRYLRDNGATVNEIQNYFKATANETNPSYSQDTWIFG